MKEIELFSYIFALYLELFNVVYLLNNYKIIGIYKKKVLIKKVK